MNAGKDAAHADAMRLSVTQCRSAQTILCIDDDPNISEALGRRLHRHGIEVLRAFDGMQGYWQAVTSKPDVIVLDLAMPNGEGADILEVLKRNALTAGIPVIVLSGKLHPSLSRSLEKRGASRCLSKPIPFDDLFAELGRHMAIGQDAHRSTSATEDGY